MRMAPAALSAAPARRIQGRLVASAALQSRRSVVAAAAAADAPVAIVTGASRGIGKAIALKLGAAGGIA